MNAPILITPFLGLAPITDGKVLRPAISAGARSGGFHLSPVGIDTHRFGLLACGVS
jgi:hypothetical protein